MLRFWEETLRYFYKSLPGGGVGTRLLDVGCGRGALVAWAEQDGLRAVGVEPFWPAPFASDRVVRAYAEELPFTDRSFDVVVSFSVLAHVRDPGVALREIARVLMPGGRAFVAVPELEGYRFLRRDIYAQLTSERWLRVLVARQPELKVVGLRHIGLKYAVPLLKRIAIRLAPRVGVATLGWIYRRSYPLAIADLSICELRRI
jgi:SAM-dependent methyltransferase